MRWSLALCAVALSLTFARPSAAQPTVTPPGSGLYESWSPLRMAPVGSMAAAPTALPRWLAVVTAGDACVITFEPDRRVVWRVRYGPHGPTEEVTEVDGERFSRTEFGYDDAGHLARGSVEGAGLVAGPWVAAYRTDPATGRVLERDERLVLRHSFGSRNLPAPTAEARWVVTWSARGAVARQLVDGEPVRTDTFDLDGRLLRTDFAVPPRPPTRRARDRLTLWYRRDARGALAAVEREFDATGLLVSPFAACICGFCVDAALAVDEPDATAVDLHWTRGPWVRLDGRVDVTAEHRVMTPGGPVRADLLRAGAVVLDAAGRPRVLRSVTRLAGGRERLGRNVRTPRGSFAAGGLRFESEAPRA